MTKSSGHTVPSGEFKVPAPVGGTDDGAHLRGRSLKTPGSPRADRRQPRRQRGPAHGHRLPDASWRGAARAPGRPGGMGDRVRPMRLAREQIREAQLRDRAGGGNRESDSPGRSSACGRGPISSGVQAGLRRGQGGARTRPSPRRRRPMPRGAQPSALRRRMMPGKGGVFSTRSMEPRSVSTNSFAGISLAVRDILRTGRLTTKPMRSHR